MKKLTLLLFTALCALHPSLRAEPVDLTNTSGTTLTVELLGTEGGQVTFTRIEDAMEFTIPLSMLDEASQNEVKKWELQKKFQPGTAPFFRMDGEYVIPIDIQGNKVTYFDANGQKQEKTYQEAINLRRFVDQNKQGLGMKPRKGFNGIKRVQNGTHTTLMSDTGATVIFNKEDGYISFLKELLSSQNEPQLHEISYEVFLPKEIQTPGHKQLGGFLSRTEVKFHPLKDEIQEKSLTGEVRPEVRSPLPATLTAGKWVKNKAIVRTFKYAVTLASFNNFQNTPVGVRNIEFKPVQPRDNLLTLEDLKAGYNLFTSFRPFHIGEKSGAVEIRAQAPLQYNLVLDEGYQVEIEAEYENGKIDAEAEIYEYQGKKLHPVVRKINLRKDRKTSGSKQSIKITYNAQWFTPTITLESDSQSPMILHKFNVSVKKTPDAHKLILHR